MPHMLFRTQDNESMCGCGLDLRYHILQHPGMSLHVRMSSSSCLRAAQTASVACDCIRSLNFGGRLCTHDPIFHFTILCSLATGRGHLKLSCERVIACVHVPAHDRYFLKKKSASSAALYRLLDHLQSLLLCKSLRNMQGAQHRHDRW